LPNASGRCPEKIPFQIVKVKGCNTQESHVLRVVIAGLIAGWLTGKLMHGRGYGFIADILLGLIGAVIGNWIFGLFGVEAHGGIGFIAMAVVGAVVLVGAINLISGHRR
jgi:uncharacterized membrane protein YeaQ/YmgE (transglycosylase-associated protein family)